MAYGPSINWKPTTKEEIKAYNKKFSTMVNKHGVALYDIACIFEKYLDATMVLKDYPMERELRLALCQFDSIYKKAKRSANISASRVKTEKEIV